MNVNGVTGGGIGSGVLNPNNVNKPSNVESATKSSTLSADHGDKFMKQGMSFAPSYTKEAQSKKDATSDYKLDLNAQAEARIKQFEKFLSDMTLTQGSKAMQKYGEGTLYTEEGMASFIQDNPFNLDLSKIEDMPDKDDYFSVENTANRIFDFAKNMAGGDEEKLKTLKDAVIKGFEAAYSAVGGKDKMPKITENTYNRVMELFDKQGNDSADKASTTTVADTTGAVASTMA